MGAKKLAVVTLAQLGQEDLQSKANPATAAVEAASDLDGSGSTSSSSSNTSSGDDERGGDDPHGISSLLSYGVGSDDSDSDSKSDPGS